MDVYPQLTEIFSAVPQWVPLFAFPALLGAAALVFALVGGRRAYPFVAAGTIGLGSALTAAREDVRSALVYCGLFAVAAAVFALLFLLPRRKKRDKISRGEAIYRRFREQPEEEGEPLPPKVICYREAPSSPEENGARLEYVRKLIEKLKTCKLTPADRLELDTLSRTVEERRADAPDGESAGLNDCLASVLRLTAKYRL